MRKNLIFTWLIIAGISTIASAQIAKKVVVEHFTNTRCSVCASRNPGFYTNLSNQADALHISYHPSSPYPTCIISQSNAAENDGRANYYGVYGGTPTLVIQGTAISASQNYGNAALFDPFEGQSSPVMLRVEQVNLNDTAEIRIVVKTIAANAPGSAKLFAAISEDTLQYNAPNGENFHYDVFRKTLLDITGETISIPGLGDSLVIELKSWINPLWIRNQLSTLVVLQETQNRSVIQAEKAAATESEVTRVVNSNVEVFSVYPNPASSSIVLESSVDNAVGYALFDSAGLLVQEGQFNRTTSLNVQGFSKGVYFLRLQTNNGVRTEKVILY